MATISVEVTGATIDCIFLWAGKKKPLINQGSGKYTCSFDQSPGLFLYSITVFGAPGDAWSAKLTGGAAPRNHSGHFSPANTDGTGDTVLEVK